MLLLGAAEPAFARSPRVTGNLCTQGSHALGTNVSADGGELAQDLARRYAQAWQVMSMHGVRYTPDVYLQFYSDADLVTYLSGLSDLIVLAVYSPSPIHFRYGEVFLSRPDSFWNLTARRNCSKQLHAMEDALGLQGMAPASALCRRNLR